MRSALIILALLAVIGWLQRDAITAALRQPGPAAAAQPVYRWTDAHGKVQYSDKPGAANAVRAQLKPLNTIKGASAAELAGNTAKALPGQAAPTTQPAQAVPCDLEDAEAQARCIHAQTTPSNPVIERLRQLSGQLGK